MALLYETALSTFITHRRIMANIMQPITPNRTKPAAKKASAWSGDMTPFYVAFDEFFVALERPKLLSNCQNEMMWPNVFKIYNQFFSDFRWSSFIRYSPFVTRIYMSVCAPRRSNFFSFCKLFPHKSMVHRLIVNVLKSSGFVCCSNLDKSFGAFEFL